ncbi:MAG: Ig-like domain-containing protein, partial [Lachnospiraceae bacterium]|nr:Ig-like domain-containing protein [Lachnospiraceae bacterium]
MSKCIEWMRKTSKRGIAFGLAAALVLSTLTVSSFADAAKQPKPALNTKRKTMYYDVFSRKTYNLKIKNIKASSIVSTKWKTSNKKVVAISKKKDKSVLLTAKKKGKATITATVKYIPKGTFKISKKRLTCKVTSKSDGGSDNFTPQPTGVVSPVPTDTALPEPTKTTSVPTNTPSPDKTGTPAPTETPVVMETPVPTDTPEPGNTDTPVIDDEAPAVEGADVTDYKTITIYFTEPVTGEPFVDVYGLDEATVKQESVLAEDGKSMTINCREALPAGTYNIIITG